MSEQKTQCRESILSATERVAAAQPWRDRVAKKAYELYVNRGRLDGHDIGDWLDAERSVAEEINGEPESQDMGSR